MEHTRVSIAKCAQNYRDSSIFRKVDLQHVKPSSSPSPVRVMREVCLYDMMYDIPPQVFIGVLPCFRSPPPPPEVSSPCLFCWRILSLYCRQGRLLIGSLPVRTGRLRYSLEAVRVRSTSTVLLYKSTSFHCLYR
jgi:hypothetical protein